MYLLEVACDRLPPMCDDEPLARAARSEAAGCAAFSKMEGKDGRRLDSRTLPDAEAPMLALVALVPAAEVLLEDDDLVVVAVDGSWPFESLFSSVKPDVDAV